MRGHALKRLARISIIIAALGAPLAARAGESDAPPVAPLIPGSPAANAPPVPAAPPPPADEESAVDDADEDDAAAEEASPQAVDDERYEALQEEVRQLRGIVNGRKPAFTLGGYADFGFFAAQGDGSGFIQDLGPPSMRFFPQYASRYGWVFLGDIMAPAINSRGEPADLGNPPGVDRADLIDSNGAPSFIVNEVNLTLNGALASSVLGTASINFVPRTGTDFRLGDVFDVDLAYLEWLVGRERRTSVFVGKFDSVIGIEYQSRKANQRFGITPSLIARYTTGTPLGIKARTHLGANDFLTVAAALTNGSSVIEPFFFYDETDSNAGKTASGRVSVALPLPFRLEIGVSGEYGAQDRALDSRHPIWFEGADLQLVTTRFQIKAELLRGHATGEQGAVAEGARRVYGLDLKGGGYVQATAMVTWALGVLLRAEFRDALVWLGDPMLQVTDPTTTADRIYITKSWRFTAGLRFVVSDRIVAKIEYLHNGEYGGVPSIPNDVFTSSVVMSY
jgi:hypothetical protein